MTVVILRLSGLDPITAMAEADKLLSARDRYPYLDRTLVVDDTRALAGHAGVFERLLKSRRLDHMLCVAVGPRDPRAPVPAPGQDLADSQRIRVPANIGGGQGSAVLWVSDPRGIDCRLSAAANADGHIGTPEDGLESLVEVLSVDDVYDKVLELVRDMRDGVASPGLHLADGDDEAAAFSAALAMAIARLTAAGSGPAAGAETAFPWLLPGATGMANLAQGGELASYRDQVAMAAAAAVTALAKRASGLFRKAPPDATDDVIAVGNALHAFRDRVSRLLAEAQAPGELTEAQRAAVVMAGVQLPASLGGPAPDAGTGQRDSDPSPVRRAVAEAIRSGDTLPRVMRRLNLTVQQLKHAGSAAYLPEVDSACPPGLLSLLAAPPQRPQGKSAAEAWRRGLGLTEATAAADALAALVVRAATREWSGSATMADEVARTRIALDGVGKMLAEHAAATVTPDIGGARAARRARLGDTLTPILCDLVDKVIAAESVAPSSGGQDVFERAKDQTAGLLGQWERHAAGNGATSPPPFATSAVYDHVHAGDDIATLRETLRYDPAERMWQLCEPDDLGVLDMAQAPRVVAFASRMDKDALGDNLPEDITWTASGSHAGLLRLVALRRGTVRVESDGEPGGPAELAS